MGHDGTRLEQKCSTQALKAYKYAIDTAGVNFNKVYRSFCKETECPISEKCPENRELPWKRMDYNRLKCYLGNPMIHAF